MQFKKLISCGIAFVMLTLSVFTGISQCQVAKADDKVAYEVAYEDILDFTYNDGTDQYRISFKSDFESILTGKGISSAILEIPDEYDDNEHGQKEVTFVPTSCKDNNGMIKELRLPKSYYNVGAGGLAYFKGLTKVVFPYEGTGFNVTKEMQYSQLYNKNPSLTEIHIYAASLDTSFSATAFRVLPENQRSLKVYVANESVKNQIVEITSGGAYPVTEEQISIIETGKKSSSLEIECEDIYFGDPNGFQPTVKSRTGDGEITYTLYKDIECKEQASNKYNSSSLPIDTYYIRGFMLASDEYDSCESNVVEVHVKKNEPTDKTELNAAIKAAEEFYEENRNDQENFDATAWSAVYGQSGALAKAQRIAADEKGEYNQEQVNEAAKNLTDALETLKKSTADTTEAWNTLQELIRKAEAIVARAESGEIVYTEASYSNLTREINEAKDLDQDTATMREIERISHLLQSAIEGLKVHNEEVPAGKPFAYVNKGGKETLVLSMTAPDPMAGAKKIKVTFDCAEDVHFNENATIDITALVAGTKSYQQFKGNNYTAGGTNAVELPLEAEIKAGDSVELAAATWSWDNAKDYVYGITKLEFMDAEGRILYTVIDQDIARENLASAIKDAEEIDTSAYTEESVAKLTKALEDAKALKNDATVEEINQAIAAINDAINGLVKKTDDKKPGDDPGQPGDETPGGNDNQDDPQVIGAAQGKVFTAGNFQYKVTAAATITAVSQKKTAGKVTVVGLTKAGKKKSSISVKDTVSASGATYHVTAIGNKAFQKAAKLKKATLGTGIKSIPASAFDGCKKLTAVSAAGVTKIEKSAFKGCKALKKLTLKKKLTSAKKGAFKGCKKTIKVTGGSKKVNKANVTKLKKTGYKKFK